MGSVFAVATLGLSITPAQADSPGGGGSLMPKPGVGVVPSGPDPLDDPAQLADFLSRCGDNCTVENARYAGDKTEGTPERIGKPVPNCNPSAINTGWSEAETKTEGLVIGMSLGIGGEPTKTVTATPSIQYTSTTSTTVGQDVRLTEQPAYTIAWLDKVPTTQKLEGTWKLKGVDQSNPFAPVNEFNSKGPRTFDNVVAKSTFVSLKPHYRAMTAEEKAQCSNTSAT
ncbi:hypothetical protein OHS81_16720 [Streptomyces sp. NBC_00400]|uniref:hypothetical protein n=1 Tax=Streptomyces sp. NBC_00400 TaxID=2975737 RepID=UPI002E209453